MFALHSLTKNNNDYVTAVRYFTALYNLYKLPNNSTYINYSSLSSLYILMGSKYYKKRHFSYGCHFAISYKYQHMLQSNKRVLRHFSQSKQLHYVFSRVSKKVRISKKTYTGLFHYIKTIMPKTTLTELTNTNFLKFFFLKSLLKPATKQSNFTLRRKLFLTTPNITRSVADLVYSVAKPLATRDHIATQLSNPAVWQNSALNRWKKKSQKTVIFYNAHKSLIWKMRSARYAHWWTQTRGTLNEWRYDKLLSRELGTYLNYFQKQLLCVVFTSLYCCFLSWKRNSWFFSNNLCLLNGNYMSQTETLNTGDIIEFPYGPGLDVFNSFNEGKYLKHLIAAKRFMYKTKFSHKPKNLTSSHKCPTMIQKLPVGLKHLGKLVCVDTGLKTVSIIHRLPYLTHSVTGNVLVSAVLTLQNWRFRFD